MKYIEVKIPKDSIVKINGYLYLTTSTVYNPKTKNSLNKRVIIGKILNEKEGTMLANSNFFKYFPNDEKPNEILPQNYSLCLSIGVYSAIKKIIEDMGIYELMQDSFGNKCELILSLAEYALSSGMFVAQHFGRWCFNNANWLKEVPSEGCISNLYNRDITIEKIGHFLNEWTKKVMECEKNKDILIALDSTNMNINSPGIDIAEYGHPKIDEGLKQINMTVALNESNGMPIYYDIYPGSINDMSHLELAIEKAKGYGMQNLTFVMDRGYYSKKNMNYIREKGYNYIYMAKNVGFGINEIFEKYKDRVKSNAEHILFEHHTFGLKIDSIDTKLFPADANVYIFYNDDKYHREIQTINHSLDILYSNAKKMKKPLNEHTIQTYNKYLDLKLDNENRIISLDVNKERYQYDLDHAGYYFMVTSSNLDPAELLSVYKKRDIVEKLFRSLKTELDLNKLYAQNIHAYSSKIFIGFLASIIRATIQIRLAEYLKEHSSETMNSIIDELEKVQIIRQIDSAYQLMYGYTKKQKEILKRIGLKLTDITKDIAEINQKIT